VAFLSSPRRRRRLAKLTTLAAVLAAAGTAAYVFLPNSSPREHFEPGKAVVLKPPEKIRLTPRMRAGISATIDRFVREAVARRNLAASYDLVTEDMKGGMTRGEWAKGDVPVYPYPVRAHSWTVDYAYPNDVTIDVMMQPTVRMRRKVGPLVMRSELVRRHGRWLVESFIAQAVFSAEGAPRTTITSHPDFAPPSAPANAADKSPLGVDWLLVPAALLSLVLLVPIAIGIVRWRRDRRAAQQIERELGQGFRRPLTG
jgi:hypothetical protein